MASSAVRDALDGERNLELLLDALDGPPIEGSLVFAAGRAAAAAGDVALGEIALAPAVMGGVDREAERAVVLRHRAFDIIVDPGFVAAHIELEHAQRIGLGLGDRFETGIADRTQHMGDAEFRRRLDHRRGAAGMEAFQRADRAQHDRQPQLAAEHFGRSIDLADVAQHARPERDRVERHPIAPQRRFGLGAADDVIPIVLIEVLPGLGDKLVQVLKFVRRGRVGGGARFIRLLIGHRESGRLVAIGGRKTRLHGAICEFKNAKKAAIARLCRRSSAPCDCHHRKADWRKPFWRWCDQ